MDVPSIKIDLIHWLTELEDQSVLEKIQGLKEEQERSLELTVDQHRELEKRLEKYEAGEMRFSSWETVKKRIKERAKDDL